jgi:hypothetical protein
LSPFAPRKQRVTRSQALERERIAREAPPLSPFAPRKQRAPPINLQKQKNPPPKTAAFAGAKGDNPPKKPLPSSCVPTLPLVR